MTIWGLSVLCVNTLCVCVVSSARKCPCSPDGNRGDMSSGPEYEFVNDSDLGSKPGGGGEFSVRRSRRMRFLEKWCPMCHQWHPVSLRVSHDSSGRQYKRWVVLSVPRDPYILVDDMGTEEVQSCNGRD